MPHYGDAAQVIAPAVVPSPNGAYILCRGKDMDCYSLRTLYNNTNTLLEHVADRLLLRTGGHGFLQREGEAIPLTWEALAADLVRVRLKDASGTVWDLFPEGAFLRGESGKSFVFVRSEREYEDTDGGAVTLP